MSRKLNRRRFLEQLGSVTAASLATSVTGVPSLLGTGSAVADAEMAPGAIHDRRQRAYRLRHDAALIHSNLPLPAYPTNGDEERYPTKIASFTKCLPHNQLGEVDLAAYTALLKAITTEAATDFEAIPLGGTLVTV